MSPLTAARRPRPAILSMILRFGVRAMKRREFITLLGGAAALSGGAT